MALFYIFRGHVSLSGSWAIVFVAGLFNYIMQAHICVISVCVLHILKGTPEGLHISLHLLEKLAKGKLIINNAVYLERLTKL